MSEQAVINVQKGIWIDSRWLEQAGLGSQIELIIQSGEIRIVSAKVEESISDKSQIAWEAFLSLEKDAPEGKYRDVSTNHDRYLYPKD